MEGHHGSAIHYASLSKRYLLLCAEDGTHSFVGEDILCIPTEINYSFFKVRRQRSGKDTFKYNT